jgi:mRNA-degrading endonuclease YafQ of YafQ-DinJ toxin-antitoxin module
MRRIERTDAFRRDFKREKSGQHRRELEPMLTFAVSLLAEDKPLPEKITTMRWEEIGATTGSATSNRICC